MTGSAVKNEKSHFWTFSLVVYGARSVETECLDLQDRYGIDINLLLFCAFLGAVHGVVLSDLEMRSAVNVVEVWHNKVVGGLRDARRALKPFATDQASAHPGALKLRESVKALELEAERLQQMMLQEWSISRLAAWPRTQPDKAIAANIEMLFKFCGGSASQPELPRNLMAAAVNVACFDG